MVQKEIRKLTLAINATILIMVFALMGFFMMCHARFLIWFSIPTAAVYIIGFILISKDKMNIYVRMVYGWLTLYMSIATVCLGYGFGFHLYSMSMIPIIFYTEYMAFRLNTKSINDRYGHSAGDEVLRKVAQTIEETCTDCTASRWGGEEFLILTGSDSGLIEKLRKAVEDLTIEFEDKVIKVTLTAGFEPKNKELTLDKWIVTADEKLYQGKNSGKNRVVT